MSCIGFKIFLRLSSPIYRVLILCYMCSHSINSWVRTTESLNYEQSEFLLCEAPLNRFKADGACVPIIWSQRTGEIVQSVRPRILLFCPGSATENLHELQQVASPLRVCFLIGNEADITYLLEDRWCIWKVFSTVYGVFLLAENVISYVSFLVIFFFPGQEGPL